MSSFFNKLFGNNSKPGNEEKNRVVVTHQNEFSFEKKEEKNHIYIENVEIFCDIEDAYIPGKIKLMGATVEYIMYYPDSTYESDTKFEFPSYPIQYKIINVINEDLLEISISYLERVRISKDEFEKFLNYNKEQNTEFFKEIEKTVVKINNLTDKLIKYDAELNLIIHNFVLNMPEQLMKDPDEICKFEMLFEFYNQNRASKHMLQSSEIERAKLRELEEIDYEELRAVFKCNMDLVLDYYNEHFEFLVKIIVEKYENELRIEFMSGEILDISYYIALMMINRVVKEDLSKL